MVIGIIPVRMASTRFPGKPLAKIKGHSMIEHVYRRSLKAKNIDDLYIATCDREIAHEAESFGAKFIMTADTHTRGTDRVVEAARQVSAEIIINIQGDEPLVDPASLDKAIDHMQSSPDIQTINFVSLITDWDVFIDHGVVKTVVDKKNKVLYFSRQPVPACSKGEFRKALKQIGIYLFRKEFLLVFSSWDETNLEIIEKVDMLRILENGHTIDAVEVKDMVSVDTPEDLSEVEKLMEQDLLFQEVFKVNCA